MNSNFYRAFEERYYAPRSVITELRRQYLPFVKVLSGIYPKGKAYDAGCGRGEWLELMLEEGLDPYGVDLEDGMLAACYELKLSVGKGDAVEFIASLEDESQIIVTAFHVVEHISFSALQTFINDALRVLKPGGLLIMETPNPENIKVATENFYLDPTHIKPIPSKLLSFLPEFYGYKRTKIIRLQENKELVMRENISLLDVIDGTSPDYAVIAQKEAHEEILEKFDDAFSNSDNTGLPLTELAAKFENRLQEIETKAEHAETKAEHAETKAEHAETKAEQLHTQLNDVYTSRSWRITSPFRKFAHHVRIFKNSGFYQRKKAIIKNILRSNISRSIAFLNSQPRLRRTLISTSKAFGLYNVFHSNYQRYLSTTQSLPENFTHNGDSQHRKTAYLTPHARNIYNDLKGAIANQKKSDE